MPCNHRVASRRNTSNLECSVWLADGEERVFEDADISLHPWVLVALHRNQSFSSLEFMRHRSGAIRLRLVPVVIVPWREVNVVLRRIAIRNVQFLIDHRA